MMVLVRHYLHKEPARDLGKLLEQYVEALWIEERQATLINNAIVRAFGEK